ncbi:MAG: 50S ribosomal protein L11 methyltransferase [Desulfobacterales bacterium]|nr:50S ribosomal protein L11 methyltransferase [Desulfobacterales bacterium]
MRWIEVKVIFDFQDTQLATELISNLFYDLGLQGVVVETPEIDSSQDWGDDAVIPEHWAVIGYFSDDEQSKKRLETIEKNIKSLETTNGIISHAVYAKIDEADWAETWKAFFKPEKITKNIVVKPIWKDYSRNRDEIVLEIDPGMAFGTGTHPTTCMCIAMIEKYLKKDGSFLDVGTGSGILMVAAAKLGAINLWGTDNDDVAVDIACKNLIQNKISESTFKILTTHLVDTVTQRFDLVAANLTTTAVLTLLDDIKRVLAPNGLLICSGIVEADKEKVLEKMANLDFEALKVLIKEGWVSFVCRPM